MDNKNLADAVSVTGIFSILFLFAFHFNLTKSPMLLLLMGMVSFGYMLLLLGLGNIQKNKRINSYLVFGIFIILLGVLCAFGMPHTSSLFV